MNSDKVIKYMNIVLDYVDNLSESEGSLAMFWLSFIEMAKILPNLLTATLSGNWHLFLETIRDILPYTFAYDNINYSRYLTVMLAEMISLQTENPGVYQQFMAGNFTAQLSEHSTFGRMEPDKVIEMTINKVTKTPGGTTGFTMKADAIMRWTLNASYRAELRKCLYTHLNYSQQLYSHKDLTTSRILEDEKDVKSIMVVA